jgi:hypothetical protein
MIKFQFLISILNYGCYWMASKTEGGLAQKLQAAFLVTPGFMAIHFPFDGFVSDFTDLGHKTTPLHFA